MHRFTPEGSYSGTQDHSPDSEIHLQWRIAMESHNSTPEGQEVMVLNMEKFDRGNKKTTTIDSIMSVLLHYHCSVLDFFFFKNIVTFLV